MISFKYVMEQILSSSCCSEITQNVNNLWLVKNQVYLKINLPEGKNIDASLLL